MTRHDLFALQRECIEHMGQLTWHRDPGFNRVVANLRDGWMAVVRHRDQSRATLSIYHRRIPMEGVRFFRDTVAELAADLRALTQQLALHELDTIWIERRAP